MASPKEKYTILVVDRSPSSLELFAAIFKKPVYTLITQKSPEFIIPFLVTHPVDLLLLDVNLNDEKNGRHICKKLKMNKATKHIPILLMSGDHHLLDYFDECGANGIIKKPFDIKEVSQQVRSILQQPVT